MVSISIDILQGILSYYATRFESRILQQLFHRSKAFVGGRQSPRMSQRFDVVGNTKANFWVHNPESGYDLTHPEKPGDTVMPRIRLSTTTVPIIIAPRKTALVIVDMQNFFLGMSNTEGEGHKAEEALLSAGIPSAREAGIQVIHVTWGISEEDLVMLPPTIFRIFGWDKCDDRSDREEKCRLGVGDDIGDLTLPDGTTVAAGRVLMRHQWNTALHHPLQKDFDESQKSSQPHQRFHKSRLTAFWGGTTPAMEFLKARGIITLMFAGVNTDQCVLACIQDANNMGFDTILLEDGCGTDSPSFATEMVLFNCHKSWGFVSSCQSLADSVRRLQANI